MRVRANLTNHGWGAARGTFTRGLGGEGGGTKLECPVLHALARSEPDDVKLHENKQLKTTYCTSSMAQNALKALPAWFLIDL